MKNFVLAVLGVMVLTTGVWAQIIRKAEVRGNARVEAEAILAILSLQEGKKFSAKAARGDIKALYKLGYFSNIEIFKEKLGKGWRLIVQVQEKPAIVEVKFQGLDELSEDDFKDKLGVKVYTILNESVIVNDVQIIERHYLEKGFYLAKVTYKVEAKEKKPNEVVLVYQVEEAGKVQVGDIHIIGNKFFSDADLVDNFFSKPITRGSMFQTPGSVYNDDFIRRDSEVLSYLYKNQGFAEIKVSSPSTVIDVDREFVRVTFEVEEGIQYRVGSLKVSGDLLYEQENLLEWMSLKNAELFHFSSFRSDVEMLVDKYGDKGYAFVDVNPVHRFDRKKKLVYLDYQITKGQKVYFGTLTVLGNTKTRDNVIRRELEIADSQLYSGTKLSRSKRNIERLGFFEEVQSIKSRDPKNANVLNYRFKVKEKPTGQLQAAVGFSPSRGTSESNFFGQGRYNEENQSGKGWKTNLTGQWNGGNNYSLELGFTDPRVNDSRWSLGFSSFWKNEVRFVTDGVRVQEKRVGGSLTAGRRVMEFLTASISYRISKIMQGSDEFLLDKFKSEGIASSITLGLLWDDTNNYLDPTAGKRVRLSQGFTGGSLLGGDRQFMETKLLTDYYYPIDFTDTYRTYFRIHGMTGILNPLGDTDIPFFSRYRLGGPEDLRGYEIRSRGPSFLIPESPDDFPGRVVYGGNKQVLFQLEYFMPIIQDANIKGLLFTDMGKIFNEDEPITLNNLDRDFGFGFRWITPIAPFRFEWAFPIENGEVGDLEFIFYLGY